MRWYNGNTMPAETLIYDLPYPLLSDPVNVHEDIQSLAERIELVLSSVGLPLISLEINNISGVTINKGDPVYITGFSTKTTVAKTVATDITTFPVVGLATSSIATSTDGVIILSGAFLNVNTSSYTVGNILYVGTSGGLTATQPATGSGAVGVVAKSHATTGVILVGQPKGNGTWGSLKAGLS